MADINTRALDRELKKGSAELLTWAAFVEAVRRITGEEHA
jgi:hypothetical protein